MTKKGKERTTLYRHFDIDGNLLYVGISLTAIQRLSQHKSAAGWYWKIANQTLEHFNTREEAERAEANAILDEKPMYNISIPRRPDGKPFRQAHCAYCRARTGGQSVIWELLAFWDGLDDEALRKEVNAFKRMARDYLKSIPEAVYEKVMKLGQIKALNAATNKRHAETPRRLTSKQRGRYARNKRMLAMNRMGFRPISTLKQWSDYGMQKQTDEDITA